MILFAVHISDGVLTAPWLAAGFVIAALLLWLAAWRIRDEEIPRIAILTAAFFVSSMIHIRVGPTSIHLLLTGLVGVMLGRRAALAIAVGLLLQMMLIGHGGWSTLGVNTCVMTVPALLCGVLFQALHRLPWIKEPGARRALVGCSAIVLFMSAAYSVMLLVFSLKLLPETPIELLGQAMVKAANERILDPWVIGGGTVFTIAAVAIEARLENAPEFPLGFLIGELAVLLTVGLNCVTLILGGETEWPIMPLLLVIAHLPFAVVEGVILGCTVGFLARVKPELLGTAASFSRDPEESAESVPFVHAASNPRSPSGRG
jgi:cobalt/nickel transport system permease protein